jgi:hypothetical protein
MLRCSLGTREAPESRPMHVFLVAWWGVLIVWWVITSLASFFIIDPNLADRGSMPIWSTKAESSRQKGGIAGRREGSCPELA